MGYHVTFHVLSGDHGVYAIAVIDTIQRVQLGGGDFLAWNVGMKGNVRRGGLFAISNTTPVGYLKSFNRRLGLQNIQTHVALAICFYKRQDSIQAE